MSTKGGRDPAVAGDGEVGKLEEVAVRDLNYDLKRLQAAHDDGSHGTRTARSYALAQIADTLHELGFKDLRVTGLKRKHVAALVKEWKRQGRSVGTMKNRMAHVRWWANTSAVRAWCRSTAPSALPTAST